MLSNMFLRFHACALSEEKWLMYNLNIPKEFSLL